VEWLLCEATQRAHSLGNERTQAGNEDKNAEKKRKARVRDEGSLPGFEPVAMAMVDNGAVIAPDLPWGWMELGDI
jgi:hypothetical protein